MSETYTDLLGYFLKKFPVSVDYHQLIYDQTVLGMGYLDCSNQTLSLIDLKLKDHNGDIVNLHGNHASFSVFVLRWLMSIS